MNIDMKLQHKFILYLVFVHLLLAAFAVFLLLEHPLYLVMAAIVLILSLRIGFGLIRGFPTLQDLISTGKGFIEDRDFNSRFQKTGHPEMDQLVEFYNRIADSLRSEKILMQEQNFFLEKILAVSPTGVITMDFDKRITMVNPAAEKLINLNATELIGRELSGLQLPLTIHLTNIKAGESRILPMSGRRRIKCHRAQFLDRGFTRDFILMEELTEEIRWTEKAAYEKVIRMMSHEINNSMGSANSLLHSCLQYSGQISGEDREDFENALKVIISRTDHLNKFMANFAEVFRLQKPNLKPVNIRGLFEEITLLFKTDFDERNIILNWDIRQEIDPVPMDRAQMSQVFTNVIKNSIEAIGGSGAITIRLGYKNGKAYSMVDDSGHGISEAVLPNLFTPFFSTKENGQGIGLTLVQEILDSHGFLFSLEGSSKQQTRFTIFYN